MKIGFIAIIAAAVGLGFGYFIFGGNQGEMAPMSIKSNNNASMANSADEEIWTCSMHPQIRQNEPGLCAICGMDLIPLEGNTSDDPLVLEMTENAVKLANIQTTVIGSASGQSEKNIRLSGKVQADERLTSSLVSHVPGRIEKLFVTFTGEQVNKGQKLATLYSPELMTAQQELLEAIKLQSVSPGLVEAARNKLRLWKIGKASIEAIEERGTIQENFAIYADESGIVTNKRVSVGDYVKQGEALFEVTNLNNVWILFDAYENELPNIAIGDLIEFTTPSIPDKTFKTRITFIDPVINPATRVASLRTEVRNKSGLLKPETFVNGMLQKKSKKSDQLTVPKSAVLWTGKRSVVYVKVPDAAVPSFQFREITLGDASGNNYQLSGGLEAGEEVVTNGSFTIDAAAQLNNQASMMNKGVKIKREDHADQLPDYTATTPIEFKQQIANLTNTYLSLKDAFVATDNELSIKEVNNLLEVLPAIDMSLLKGEAHLYWMEQLSAIQAHGKKISELSDIEDQRRQFDFLSQALIRTIKVFGTPTDTLYIQFCPMVFNNEGADWISKEKSVLNPYFGSKMLRCGVVKDTITKEFKNPALKQVSNSIQNTHKH